MEDHLPTPSMLEMEYGMPERVALWVYRSSVLLRAFVRHDLFRRAQFVWSRIFPMLIHSWRVWMRSRTRVNPSPQPPAHAPTYSLMIHSSATFRVTQSLLTI